MFSLGRCAMMAILLLTFGSVSLHAAQAKWTLLCYVNAQETIVEETFLDDFIEIAAIGSTADVNIVMQMARNDGNNEKSYGNWDGIRRGLVQQGDIPDQNWGTVIPKVSMTDASSLRDFMDWGSSSYPADRTALIMFGHGYSITGMFSDDGKYLTYDRFVSALSETSAELDLIGLSICNGGMWEVAHILAPYADVLVASERKIATPKAWPWDHMLDDLVADPTMDAAAFGTAMVNARTEVGDDYQQCMSAVDLPAFAAYPDGAKARLDHFVAVAMRDGGDADLLELHNDQLADNLDGYPVNYSINDTNDVGSLLSFIIASPLLPASIVAEAQSAADAYEQAIIANAIVSGSENDTGLAVYLPYSSYSTDLLGLGNDGSYSYVSEMDAFTDSSPWDEFIDTVNYHFREAQGWGNTITLDTTAPSAVVEQAANGSIVISFDEEMATTTFSITDGVSFTGPSGDLLSAITGSSWNSTADRLSISFSAQTAAGDYSLRIDPVLADAWGNTLSAAIEADFSVAGTDPEMLQAQVQATGSDQVRLQWRSITGADYYQVERQRTDVGNQIMITLLSADRQFLVDQHGPGVMPGDLRYAVRAIDELDPGRDILTEEDDLLPLDMGVQTAQQGDDILVEWNDITDADWYLLDRQRADASNQVMVIFLPLGTVSYLDTQVDAAADYLYHVFAGVAAALGNG